MANRLLFFIFLGFLPGIAFGQDFKVVGYLPYYRFHLLDELELERLTHLNIAFLNPDAEGNLSLPEGDLRQVIERGHAAGLEVFLSLAGGYLQPEWANAWAQLQRPQNRSAFIHRIIQFAQEYQVQGIDVDLEWQSVGDNYSGFVLELGDSLRAHGLEMTAALPGIYRYPQVSQAALEAFDWINMMVYDLRGPWDPGNVGPHSPFSFAEQAINYWQQQGVEPDRLTLGVPFYGYDFSDPNNIQAYTYQTILSWDAENAWRDQYQDTYYNGIPTIQAKTELARTQVGGIMIWEIGQDQPGPLSLLRAIDEVLQGLLTPLASSSRSPDDFLVYPNPFRERLFFEGLPPGTTIELISLTGQLLLAQQVFPHQAIESPPSLPAGMYFLRRDDRPQTLIPVIKQ
jgi:hypothetical protein